MLPEEAVIALISWVESDSHRTLVIPASMQLCNAARMAMLSATSGDPTNLEKEVDVVVSPPFFITHPKPALKVVEFQAASVCNREVPTAVGSCLNRLRLVFVSFTWLVVHSRAATIAFVRVS